MKWSYAISHWLLTLLLAPFTSELIKYLFLKDSHLIAGLLEVYPITLLFSFIFSIPAFIAYLITFIYLNKSKYFIRLKKIILIAIAVLGIIVTMLILYRNKEPEIIIAYSITCLITGLILPLKTHSGRLHKTSL